MGNTIHIKVYVMYVYIFFVCYVYVLIQYAVAELQPTKCISEMQEICKFCKKWALPVNLYRQKNEH